MSKQTIIDQLIAARQRLPKKQRAVCDYMIEHPQEVSVLALPELAEAIGVG